jgi:DeoR family transcriptional regulator, suf operon transcriptional repressor
LIYWEFTFKIAYVKNTGWRKRILESTRGRILDLLRAKEQTVNDLAAALDLTDNAVRAHLSSLERDGLVRQAGTQSGFRKPHVTYALTAESEQIFPKAYGPLLDLLLGVLSRKLSPKELRAAMRDVGKMVAANHLLEVEDKTREQRIEAALQVLKDLGGSATFHESEGKHFIRGNGCPLAAATARHPEACLIAESLLSLIIGAPVKERCIHGNAPSCRFQID